MAKSNVIQGRKRINHVVKNYFYSFDFPGFDYTILQAGE
jgi:hypothetical protein